MWQCPRTEILCKRKLKRNSIKECMYREVQEIWGMKRMIIPVINGATRIVTKGLKKFGSHTRKHSIDSLPTTAILGTSHNTESTAV
jgi:hypothetical protein